MDVLALPGLVATFVLLLAGLLVPGALVLRALDLPRTVGTCFAGSAVALYASVLALQFASVPIARDSLAAALGLISAIAWLVARRRERRPGFAPLQAARGGTLRTALAVPFGRMGGWTPLYAVVLGAVLWRAVHEPLAGPDVEFRWSFLAEQMLRTGSLDFYPPRSGADFLTYFWAESIPPGAASLHAWAYACAGGVHPGWTVPAVVLQVWGVHDLLWRTAERLAGTRAAQLACVAAAATPLLTWSLLLGQETGLTALAMIGLAFALHGFRPTGAPRWAALAGLFAVLGASAREYGLVFAGLAGFALVVLRAERRAWAAFGAVALLAALWPVRTWLLTGNPVHSLPLAGLPVNERFVAWIQHDAPAYASVLTSLGGWSEIARLVLLFAPVALAGGLALMAAAWATNPFREEARALLVAAAAVLILWLSSVRYTGGGLFYSMRVTSPALILGALAVGLLLAAAALTRPRFFTTAKVGLGLACAATLPATLALPRNPWRTPWREWPAFAAPSSLPLGVTDPSVALVQQRGSPGVVLADSPGYQRRFAPVGVKVIPPWSPDADWLFDRSLSAAETHRKWLASGVRHILVTKWQANLDFFYAHARWNQPPVRIQVVGDTPGTVLFTVSVAPE